MDKDIIGTVVARELKAELESVRQSRTMTTVTVRNDQGWPAWIYITEEAVDAVGGDETKLARFLDIHRLREVVVWHINGAYAAVQSQGIIVTDEKYNQPRFL